MECEPLRAGTLVRYVPDMFRNLRLIEAFEHLASPIQWSWFGPLVARGVYHIGLDGWPLFPFQQLRAYDVLRTELEARALEKLRSGDWIGQGISARYGPHRMPIDTHLWDYMQIVPRMEEAKGGGFHFLALTVTDTKPPRAVASQADTASLRRQLTEWIQSHAEASGKPVLRSVQLAEARAAFPSVVISANMYRECRRAAGLSSASVQTGRPKVKGREK